MLNDTLIRKFRMKRHLLWGEYKTVPGVKKGKKYNAKIWMPVDKLQQVTGRFWMPENIWASQHTKNNYNLKIFYQRATARQVFYHDPNFYYEIQGIQKHSPTWEKLNAFYCMKKMKKELPEFRKSLLRNAVTINEEPLAYLRKPFPKNQFRSYFYGDTTS